MEEGRRALAEGRGTVLSLLEVGLQTPSLISMWMMNQVSRSSTTRAVFRGGVSRLEGGAVPRVAVQVLMRAVAREADEAALYQGAAVTNVAERGEDGEIGRRYDTRCNSPCDIFLTSSQNTRTRESSVTISPQWQMLEEIEFHRLAKLRLDVEDPQDLYV